MVDLWSEKLDIHHKDTIPVYNPSREAPAYQRKLDHFDPFFFADRVVLFLRHISLWWTWGDLHPRLEFLRSEGITTILYLHTSLCTNSITMPWLSITLRQK